MVDNYEGVQSPIRFAGDLLRSRLYLLKYDKHLTYFIIGYSGGEHPAYSPTFFLSGMVNAKAVYNMQPFSDLLTIENETGIPITEWNLTLSVRGIRA